MKALLLRQQAPIETGPLSLEEIPVPEPGAGEVLIRVRACGLCHTDLHVVEGDLPARKLPVVPGHQVVGAVCGHGSGISTPRVGSRVGVPWLYDTCSCCELCRSGKENLCRKALFTGYDRDGGYAQFMVAPACSAYVLPDRLSDTAVAPLLCGGVIGYRALRLSEVRSGEVLGLFGFGASAHIVLQLAQGRGIRVFVFTRSEHHREVARQLGGEWAGRAEQAPPEALTGAIIFAPAGHLIPRALELLRPAGVCVAAGITMTPVPEFSYRRCLYDERVLRSVANSTRKDVRELLQEAERLGVTTKTQVFSLEEGTRALRLLKEAKLAASGVLAIP